VHAAWLFDRQHAISKLHHMVELSLDKVAEIVFSVPAEMVPLPTRQRPTMPKESVIKLLDDMTSKDTLLSRNSYVMGV
jgi:hypothetical protein